MNSVITITLGDVAENHAGMEKIGHMVDVGNGFNLDDLRDIKKRMKKIGANSIIRTIKNLDKTQENAYVLIIKDGVNKILEQYGEYTKDDILEEQLKIDFDKKAIMRGKLVNKHARYNVCYSARSRKPDYENGKGRIVGYAKVPIMRALWKGIEEIFGEKASNLKGECNYYYDISKTGIGYHGDSERRKVIGIRLGINMPLYYRWYKNNEIKSKRLKLDLDGGDIYVMSEKAVGTDWKKSSIYTLRHATGCNKYTK